jgi:hypothetical protein
MLVPMTVNDEINPAVLFDGPLNSSLNLSWIPDVRLDGETSASSNFRKFLGCLFQTLLATTMSERGRTLRSGTHFRPTIVALAPCRI